MANDDPATTIEHVPSDTTGKDERPSGTLSPSTSAAWTDAHAAARAHLRALRVGSAELANAVMAAGYPPRHWRAADPTLRELASALPQPSVDALLARIDRFSAESGPTWIARLSEHPDDPGPLMSFTNEVRLLDDVIRPLCALSRRRRAGAPPDHLSRPLERVLGDARTGMYLDHLAESVWALVELAPALASGVSPPFTGAASMPISPEGDRGAPDMAGASLAIATTTETRTETTDETTDETASDALTVPAPFDAPTVPATSSFAAGIAALPVRPPPAQASAPPDAPTIPWLPPDPTVPLPSSRVPRPRPRLWPRGWPGGWPRPGMAMGVALAGCVLCAVAAIVVTFASLPSAGQSARATATSASATASATTRAPTPTLGPAVLTVSPTFLTLPCPATGESATVTMGDTGGLALTWRIVNPPLSLIFSSTNGTIQPGASVAIRVRALFRLHGTHQITFASSGGGMSVNYTVCH